MSAFTLDISSSFPDQQPTRLGGPLEGDHQGSDWFVAFGNDLGMPAGTPVLAVFDGKVTKVDTTHLGVTSGGVYGAGVFVRASSDELDPDAPGGVGCFYTHIDLGPGIAAGATIARGDAVGNIVESAGIATHLHFAIAERIDGVNHGVNIYDLMLSDTFAVEVTTLAFSQDGSPPQVVSGARRM
jgi:murein DD-endopeptidase MepM/ murein hydrolase activator NlpD